MNIPVSSFGEEKKYTKQIEGVIHTLEIVDMLTKANKQAIHTILHVIMTDCADRMAQPVPLKEKLFFNKRMKDRQNALANISLILQKVLLLIEECPSGRFLNKEAKQRYLVTPMGLLLTVKEHLETVEL